MRREEDLEARLGGRLRGCAAARCLGGCPGNSGTRLRWGAAEAASLCPLALVSSARPPAVRLLVGAFILQPPPWRPALGEAGERPRGGKGERTLGGGAVSPAQARRRKPTAEDDGWGQLTPRHAR